MASLVFNGERMVMGGFNRNSGWLDGVEKKRARTDRWVIQSAWKMPQLMSNFCAVQKLSFENH